LARFFFKDVILVFGHNFGHIFWLTIFSIKFDYFLTQNSLQNGKKITRNLRPLFDKKGENPPSWTVPPFWNIFQFAVV
jgi:hypothetical protein